MANQRVKEPPGAAVDSEGRAVIDPTENVKALSEAAAKRQDDLREASDKFNMAEIAHVKEMAVLRAGHSAEMGELRDKYQAKIQSAETDRLNSIRQVDREEVAKTAVAANTAIQTLAKQTTDLQQTLAKQVTDTAAAQETRYSAQSSDYNKRLSALELSSSEGRGKATVSDPQMDKLTALVEVLARNQASGTGKSEGVGVSANWVVTGFLALIALGGFVLAVLK